MKTFVLSALLLSTPAFAQPAPLRTVELFECRTAGAVEDKGGPVQFIFAVTGFGTPKASPVSMGPYKDNIVRAKPQDSVVAALGENWGFRVRPEGFRISGDSDGFYLVELVIYANSGFTRGYFRNRDTSGEGHGNHYSLVSCRHRAVQSRRD